MFLHKFEDICEVGKSMEVKLPRKGLTLDTRVNEPHFVRFSIDYHDDGITATLHRLDDVVGDDDEYHGYDLWGYEFSMRLYDPKIETVPDFNSTIYMYTGLPGEYPPSDTTLVIIHPSVKDIKDSAFAGCVKLRRVIMHENVETIEDCAFSNCRSLDAVFLPSSIQDIHGFAFTDCPNLRVLFIPPTINIEEDIGHRIIEECHTFLRIAQLPPYEYNGTRRLTINDDQVNQALIDFNHNLPPLHKVCLNNNVTADSIRQCIETHGIAAAYNTDYGDGMTPMHILALNPHADEQAILTLFHANMGVVFETYSEGYVDEGDENEQRSAIGGRTLLDCLSEYDVKSYLSVIAALCRHREAHSNPTVEEPTRNMNAEDEDRALKRQKVN